MVGVAWVVRACVGCVYLEVCVCVLYVMGVVGVLRLVKVVWGVPLFTLFIYIYICLDLLAGRKQKDS